MSAASITNVTRVARTLLCRNPMRAFLSLALLLATTQAFAETPDDAPAAKTQRAPENAIWIQQPAGVLGGLAMQFFVMVPLGANVSGPGDRIYVVEATYLHVWDEGPLTEVNQLWGSVGVMQQLYGPTRSHGFFLAPKIFGAVSSDGAVASCGVAGCLATAPPGQSIEVQGGADLIFQWTMGHLYVGVAAGASGGYCWNCFESAPTSLFGPALASSSLQRSNHFALGLNLDLLRFGYAW